MLGSTSVVPLKSGSQPGSRIQVPQLNLTRRLVEPPNNVGNGIGCSVDGGVKSGVKGRVKELENGGWALQNLSENIHLVYRYVRIADHLGDGKGRGSEGGGIKGGKIQEVTGPEATGQEATGQVRESPYRGTHQAEL
jgi:hypothetical protein